MKLIELLVDIRDNGPKIDNAGICSNVHEASGSNIDFIRPELKLLMCKWPDAVPNTCYPVDGVCGFINDRSNGTLWQNPRRIELLNWLIAQLEVVGESRES